MPKIDKKGKEGKVLPFVSARVSGCVLTTSSKLNANPTFYTKLKFPIFYPVLNDRITMRIWAHRKAQSNVFIASIPEHPNQHDNFQISKLLT